MQTNYVAAQSTKKFKKDAKGGKNRKETAYDREAMRDARFLMSEEKENIPPGKRQRTKVPCYAIPAGDENGVQMDVSSDEESVSEFEANAKKDSDISD